MDQCVCTQQNDKYGHACVRKSLTNVINGWFRPDFDLFNNALSELKPLQPRYAKKVADEDSLMAVIIAQALNHGNLSMADTSDFAYHVLEATYQQYLRLSTLQASNDRISNFIAGLSIFPYYSFGLEMLYGSVDGQKFEMGTPTIKARYSRKYFRRGKGVVAYSLLANHVPLQTELIGAHEHESNLHSTHKCNR